jgi:hypothetical protein
MSKPKDELTLDASSIGGNDLLNNTYEQSLEVGTSKLSRINDDVLWRQQVMRTRQLRSCGAITMIVAAAIVFAALGSLR